MSKKAKEITARDYVKLVEWSEEDRCFIGSAPPLIGQSCHGPDETKVYRELCQIVEEWIALYQAEGRALPEPTANREFSGKFVLRCDPNLHKLLTMRALQEGDSLNSYCVKKLATA